MSLTNASTTTTKTTKTSTSKGITMKLSKTITRTIAAAVFAAGLALTPISVTPVVAQSHLVDAKDFYAPKASRDHILWSIDTSLNKLYNWDGFGKRSSINVRESRNQQLALMSHRELFDVYADMKRADFLYHNGFISVYEIGAVYYGDLWGYAKPRPEYHENNYPVDVKTVHGLVVVHTGAESYEGFFSGNYQDSRQFRMLEASRADGAWLWASMNYVNGLISPSVPETYDEFFGQSKVVEELWYYGKISGEERKRHFEGRSQEGDIYPESLY